MRTTYGVIGLVLIALVCGAWYLAPRTFENEAEKNLPKVANQLTTMTEMKLTSTAFQQGGTIPTKYTCDGTRYLSPPLSISGAPENTESLVLIMDDPDVPKELIPEGVFDHWVVYSIPAGTTEIPEGGGVGVLGANGRDDLAYTGPCPPTEYEPSEHRYVFRVYALDTELSFERPPTKAKVLEAIEGHVIGRAELIGKYKRP